MCRNGDIWWVADHFVCLGKGKGGYHKQHVISKRTYRVPTHNPRFPILILLWKIQWDSENVNVGKGLCQPTTPIFKVGPIYKHATREFISVDETLEKNENRTMAIETDSDLRGDVRE